MSSSAYILGSAVTLLVGYLGYLGVKQQARAAKAGTDNSTAKAETAHAMDTLRELIDPLREELAEHRQAVKGLREEVRAATERVDKLSREVHRWKAAARALAAWGVTLRDELLRLGGHVPAEPDEMALLRVLDDDDPALKPRKP